MLPETFHANKTSELLNSDTRTVENEILIETKHMFDVIKTKSCPEVVDATNTKSSLLTCNLFN